MTTHRIAAVSAALVALIATGCGGASKSSKASGEPALTTVRMVQDWPAPWVGWIPWLVADQKGYFRQAGIKLSVVVPPSTAAPAQLLAQGHADMAFTTTLDVAFARAQDAPVTAVGAYTQRNSWGIIWRQGDRADVAGLKGKKIGVYNDAWTKAQLSLMLKSAGLKLTDVTLVPAPSDTATLLLDHKVDATTGVTNAEQAEIDVTGQEHATMLLGKDHGVPDAYVDVLAANDHWLAKNHDLARRFMAAVVKGIAYSRAHPAEAVGILLQRYPKAGTRAYELAAWRNTVPLFVSPDTARHGLLWQSGAVWTKLERTLRAGRLLTKDVTPSTLFTNSLLSR